MRVNGEKLGLSSYEAELFAALIMGRGLCKNVKKHGRDIRGLFDGPARHDRRKTLYQFVAELEQQARIARNEILSAIALVGYVRNLG